MNKTPKFDQKITDILNQTQPGERTCSLTGDRWKLSQREIDWCKKFNVPPSSWSPDARWKILGGMLFGYEWWWNKHAETGKPILTYVHPATGVPVLPDKEWFEKDFRDKALDYDPATPVLDQLLKLRKTVPVNAFFNGKEPQNSISLISNGDVNSYFVIASKSKNSFFSSDLDNGESCSEIYASSNITNSFNVVHAQRIFNSRFVRESFDCSSCYFIFDCRNCEYCFGATNKRNRKYIWMNEQLSEDEWKERFATIKFGCRSITQKMEEDFMRLMEMQAYWPENFNVKAENSTGEYLANCTDCKDCFMVIQGPRDNEHCYYIYGNSERNYYVIGSFYTSDNYFSSTVQDTSHSKYSINLVKCQGLEYCLNCQNCEYCFACIGLNRQRYCILNKQYEEDEYWGKVDEIKCTMLDHGEYSNMPGPQFASSHYMETSASESLMVTEEDQKRLGFPMFDKESSGAIGDLENATDMVDSTTVPDCISDLDIEQWAGKAMLDKSTGRRFAFLKPELEYYKKMDIAPPTKHFFYRVDELYWAANQFLLEETKCETCKKKIRVAKNRTYKNRKHLCREDYLKYLEENG
ncbi:MAG: hypothetical protein ABIH21_05695 [Patescibacteria group bacterium]